MMLAHKPTKCLFIGTSGTGKTTALCRLALGALHTGETGRLFIFDGEGELAGRLGLPAVFTPEQLAHVLASESPALVFDPAETFPGKRAEAFDFFCDVVFSYSKHRAGKKLLVADEVQFVLSTAGLSEPVAIMLETGRRAGLDFIAAAQSTNTINTRFRNQLTHICAFRSIDERATRFLGDVGFDVGEIMSLRDGSGIIRDLRGGGEQIRLELFS